MKQKRILIFSLTYLPFTGGAELAVKHLTDRFNSDEWAFDLLTLRFDRRLPKRERVGNVTIHRLGFSQDGATIARTFRLPLLLNKYWFPFTAVFRAFFLHRANPYDLVWVIMANYAGFGALFFKLIQPNIPLVLTLQEGDPIEHILGRVGWLRSLFRQIFVRADMVQAISKFLAQFGQSMGAAPGRTVVIPNGVPSHFAKKYPRNETDRFQAIMGKMRGDTLLITTSRLVFKNAVDVIIRALVLLPTDVKLAVLGDGPEHDGLIALVAEVGLAGRVIFLPAVSHEILPGYLQAADVFVRPSRSEGLGSSFLEAMAAGLPVVATPVGGIPDFVIHETTGLFCEVDDPTSLAEQIARFIRDKRLRARLIKNARKLIAERYDWDIVAKRIEHEVFADILRPHP